MSTDKHRLLIVDDDALMLKVTKEALRREGWPAWQITTSETLYTPRGFDVVLADWTPHGENMAALCIAFSIPFVVFSGGDLEHIREVVPEGTPVFGKPYKTPELVAALLSAAKGESDAA